MSSFERELRASLERLARAGESELEPDWEDVLLRARALPDDGARFADRARRRRRPLLVVGLACAAVAALLATPFGRALVSDAWSGFSSWVSGAPGGPAPVHEQQQFAQANEAAPFGFPRGTKLRRLIEEHAAGYMFELEGFRAGDQLCLRLRRVGLQGPNATSCLPLHTLVAGPVVQVATSDTPFGSQDVPPTADGLIPARASATFGFVKDGIATVTVAGHTGTVRARVAANAFLAVVPDPPLGSRARRIVATQKDGATLTIPIAAALGGETGPEPAAEIPGPSRVERIVHDGAIGWLEHRKPRGEPVPSTLDLGSTVGKVGSVLYARAVRPNPSASTRIVLALVEARPSALSSLSGRVICYADVNALSGVGYGCAQASELFSSSPVSGSLGLLEGGDQFATIDGLASDDVHRLELFLASGRRQPVALLDNTFLTRVNRLDFPVRLVGYDTRGRVIATEPMQGPDRGLGASRPVAGKQHRLLETTGPHGDTATLDVGPSSTGGLCYTLRLGARGAGGRGCVPAGGPAEPLMVSLGASGARDSDVFLDFQTSTPVARIELRFQDGDLVELTPVEGFALYAVPLAHYQPGHRPELAIAYDEHGRELARQPLPTGVSSGYSCTESEEAQIAPGLTGCP